MTRISPKLPWLGVEHRKIAETILDHAAKMRVLVVGDIMMDKYTHGEAHRLSPEAPVPVVEQTKVEWCLGGAANVAANLRGMGAEVSICGYYGQDEAGERAAWMMSKRGISVALCETRSTPQTTVKHRILAGGRHVVRVDNESKHPPETSVMVALDNGIRDSLDRFDAVIVSDYTKGVVNNDIMTSVRLWNLERNHVVGLDTKPAFLRRAGKGDMTGITFVKPNRRELFEGLGLTDPPSYTKPPPTQDDALSNAIGRWFEWNTESPYLVVTLAEQGMVVAKRGDCGALADCIPALGSQVVEVSGAGDSVMAAFTLGLLHNPNQDEGYPAAIFAAQAAAVAVGRAATSEVTRTDILEAIGRGEDL